MTTLRLNLQVLQTSDAAFIFELVNSPEWIRFIGGRDIHTLEDAENYILKILDNQDVTYWTARLKDSDKPIGVITFIKREYLDHPDIGFAFLTEFTGLGYAYEASKVVLEQLLRSGAHPHILATTLPDNSNSIRLLEKLGLRYLKQIRIHNEALLIYGIAADKIWIDDLIGSFFKIFSNRGDRQPNWELLQTLCLPEAIIIKKTGLEQTVYNLDSFIAPRKILLGDGSLKDFEEQETLEKTKVIGNIAQRYSRYQKSGVLNGEPFEETGHKLFQLIKTAAGWRISALVWEDDVR